MATARVGIIATLIEARRIVRERKHKAALELELFDIARAFNDRHTYTWQPTLPNRWMCPKCNKVHASIGQEPMCGLIFPACCGAFEGHRQFNDLHATTMRMKL